MANHLQGMQRTTGPSDSGAAFAAASCTQQMLQAARGCVVNVDRALARAPGGNSGMLDEVCALTNGASRVQEFYDIYIKALDVVNSFQLNDADPDLLEQFSQADVTAAIGRM